MIPSSPRLAALVLLAALPLTAATAFAEGDSQRWSKNPAWAEEGPPDEQPYKKKSEDVPEFRERRSKVTPFAPGSNNLSLDVGQIFLLGDLGNSYTDSIGFQLHEVHAVSDIFGLDTALLFSSHGPSSGTTEFSLSSLKLGLRTNLAWYDKAIPYATFGLGFFRPSVQQADGSYLSPILFGLHFGAGVNLEISRALFFGASFTFHDMFGTKKRNDAGEVQEIDGSFASFLVSAGVSF